LKTSESRPRTRAAGLSNL